MSRSITPPLRHVDGTGQVRTVGVSWYFTSGWVFFEGLSVPSSSKYPSLVVRGRVEESPVTNPILKVGSLMNQEDHWTGEDSDGSSGCDLVK